MKEDLLTRMAPDAREMVKEAVIGALGRLAVQGLSRAGKVLVKNPMTSATAAFAGMDVGGSMKKMNDLTTGARNMMNSKMTTPANM